MSRYYIGQIHRSRKRRIITVCVVLLLAAGCVMGTIIFRRFVADTSPQVSNTTASNRTYKAAQPTTRTIDEPLFTMDIPTGWSAYTITNPTTLNNPQYSYRSSAADARSLSVYLDDRIPSSLAVNKVVVVTANGNRIGHADVSDNCASFTRPGVLDPGSGVATGQWQGVSFLCDLGNYTRNVIGTVSTGSQDGLAIVGQRGTRHRVYFTFSDNGSNPDYTVFYAILSSFNLK